MDSGNKKREERQGRARERREEEGREGEEKGKGWELGAPRIEPPHRVRRYEQFTDAQLVDAKSNES